MHDAIKQLTTTIAEIQGKVTEKGQQDFLSWFENSQSDKSAIASWRQELVGVLLVFNTELNINTRVAVERYHRDVLAALGDAHLPTQVRIPSGESPPPAPKAFFGRDGLVDEIVSRAEKLEFIALIGAGGIGKTSLALTVLHDKRIKEQFGANRRFVSCDKPPVSRANFLARLSKVVGAGVETPEDLATLRPLLSSQQMLIILDNAESILDPQGTDARAIYAIVKELSDFNNICLGITSRISTVPPHCKRLEIPTLTMEAARDVFYSIYGDGERSNIIDDLLQRLDFHALSITLLATVASDNKWSYDRLAEEWGEHHSQMLKTDHNDSLAATIKLSLTCPTFRKLGPNARDLLGVVAFYPQGVDEKNLKWFFPTIPDRQNIFDKFCVLSLAHRNNGFITMLAPLRDYL
ncbi:P-loop containing nucleoside triphosphate hydrolase protein, partial [Thelephora terrestris]